jgi:hypothetical protein
VKLAKKNNSIKVFTTEERLVINGTDFGGKRREEEIHAHIG